MKNIEIKTPDGKTLSLTAPDDASQEQIHAAATQAMSHYQTTMKPQQSAPEQPGMVRKAWDAMNIPSQMSKDGLNQMVGLQNDAQNAIAQKTGLPIGTEPTGNMARDVIANTPRIAGETMAEVAPGFIDRTSMLLAGAGMAAKGAGMAAGEVLPKVAPMLENGSGLPKGTLVAAFKDPKMIADFGARMKASALYDEIKEGASVPTRLRTNAKVVSSAMNEMAKGNVLTAPDAFEARKAVNALMKSKQYPIDDLLKAKQGLEAMVFSSVKDADQMYVRAIRGEAMRNYSRLNKNGTTGPISAALMSKMPWLTPLMSPAVQGIGASAAGAASEMNPASMMNASSMVGAGLDRLRKRGGK